MAMTTSITCDGCQGVLEPKKPEGMWHGKLPLPNPAPQPTAEQKEKAKREGKGEIGWEPYSVDHAVLCKACTHKVGEFIQSLKG